jgi:hypothetical protein
MTFYCSRSDIIHFGFLGAKVKSFFAPRKRLEKTVIKVGNKKEVPNSEPLIY